VEINVDTDALVVYTNKLEKLPKSAFPNAVRGTLNGLAFDVKKNTMPESAKNHFTIRQNNFFKANSRVETARGFDIDTMKSTVGFVPFGGTNTAIENLEQQETGGVIPGRAFIPMDKARTGNSPQRVVSRRNRITGIKNIVRVDDAKGKTPGEKFIKSVVFAGKGGHVLHENTLFRVDRLSRAGSNWKFKLAAIYSFEKGRKARIARATHFMEKAVEKTVQKADDIYIKEAERQFTKHMR
jgi:hypothetical protein